MKRTIIGILLFCSVAFAVDQYQNQIFHGTITLLGIGNGPAKFTSNVLGSGQINLASTNEVTGILPIANGGLGASSTSQNFVLAGPTSGSGAPSLRALVSGDIPNNAANTTGTATNATNVATTQISTNASYFPLFVASSTNGNQAASLATGFSFNPSTKALSLTGALDLASHQITSVTDPTTAQMAATKNYVDTQLAQLNPAAAVYAASTVNIVGTYLNLVSGVCIGDTFTVTATGAFTVDGATPPIGSRVLLKNQTSTFQDGVWTVTNPGSLGVSPIFTRALDYDSAADFNAGQIIPVQNGAQAGSSWYQTAVVTACNTDAQTYTKFQNAASAYLLSANNLSDVGTKATAFNNLSPMVASGDIIYGGISGSGTVLTGNITTTPKILTQTGTGAASASPVWNAIATLTGYANAFTSYLAASGTISSSDSIQTAIQKLDGTSLFQYFGNGYDGNITITSNNATIGPLVNGLLTRPAYFNNLTISGSGSIQTNGFPVYILGTLDITGAAAGSIICNGPNGGAGATAGTAGSAGTGVLNHGVPGGQNAGGAATGGTTTGAQGLAQNNGAIYFFSYGSGGGGAGGTGSSGSGGAAKTAVTTLGRATPIQIFTQSFLYASFAGAGGNGGSGGGGDGTAGAGGGGGGAGGGSIVLYVNNWKASGAAIGAIQAIGGSGGSGGAAVAGSRGGGGGGGGGAGGWILIYYANVLSAAISNDVDVSGGAGGAGGNGTNASGGGGGGDGGPGGHVDIINVRTWASTIADGGSLQTGNAGSGTNGGAQKAGQVTQVTF